MCWGYHIRLGGSCGVDMLRLYVSGGGLDSILCEGPRSSLCVPTMLIGARKHYSQILILNKVGLFSNKLYWHFVTILREWDGVWCCQDILLVCGQSHSVLGFQWANVCGVGLLRSSILSSV